MNDIEKAISVLEMENELMQFDPNTGDIYPIKSQNQDNQDLYNANLIAIVALEKQLNGGWISASERLPKEDEDVLVTTIGNQVCWAFRYLDEWNTYLSTFENEDVLAWMPLPELYKGVENEL